MIKERYCSHEVSKLLREKGFDEPCLCAWLLNDGIPFRFKYPVYHQNRLEDNEYLCPTHQMAMDWLIEVHKIAINIRITCEKTISYVFDVWDFNIIHPNKFVGGTIDLREQQFGFKSYGEACEAALKYCLTELI